MNQVLPTQKGTDFSAWGFQRPLVEQATLENPQYPSHRSRTGCRVPFSFFFDACFFFDAFSFFDAFLFFSCSSKQEEVEELLDDDEDNKVGENESYVVKNASDDDYDPSLTSNENGCWTCGTSSST